MNPSKIIVTNCHTRMGYQVVQSLTASGWPVVAAAWHTPSMCRHLAGVVAEVEYDDPFSEPYAFIQVLIDAVHEHQAAYLFPVHEETFVVAWLRHLLEPYVGVLVPSFATLMALHDKAFVAAQAQAVAVPVPSTHPVDTVEELEQAAATLKFPLIVKPRFGSGAAGTHLLHTSKDFSRLLASVKEADLPLTLLAQQWVPGKGAGVSALVCDGKTIAVCGHKRLREVPIRGGTSTARQTLQHLEMEEAACRLIEQFEMRCGVVMIEFRYDEETEQYWVVEANPRYWGSLSIAIGSGVDIPSLHLQCHLEHLMLGTVIRPSQIIESRWALGELRAAAEFFMSRQWQDGLNVFRTAGPYPICYDDIGRGKVRAFLNQVRAYSRSFQKYGNFGFHSPAKKDFFKGIHHENSG